MLVELPELLSDARIHEVIACAAAGAEADVSDPCTEGGADAGPEAVYEILREEVGRRLMEARPDFRAAALALREALELS